MVVRDVQPGRRGHEVDVVLEMHADGVTVRVAPTSQIRSPLVEDSLSGRCLASTPLPLELWRICATCDASLRLLQLSPLRTEEKC